MPSFIFTASQGFYGSAFFLQNIAQIKFFHVHVVRFAQLQLTVIFTVSEAQLVVCSSVQYNRHLLSICNMSFMLGVQKGIRHPKPLKSQDYCMPNYVGLQLLGVNAFYLLSVIKNSLGTEAEFNFFCIFPGTIVNIAFVT